MRPTFRLNEIVRAADGRHYLSVVDNLAAPPPGPGWRVLGTIEDRVADGFKAAANDNPKRGTK